MTRLLTFPLQPPPTPRRTRNQFCEDCGLNMSLHQRAAGAWVCPAIDDEPDFDVDGCKECNRPDCPDNIEAREEAERRVKVARDYHARCERRVHAARQGDTEQSRRAADRALAHADRLLTRAEKRLAYHHSLGRQS